MSLTDDFVKDVEHRILTGDLVIGSKIPPLRELADSYDVSRSVINAGIVELQNKGYLLTVPRKCTVVADWKKHGTLAVFDGLIANNLYDKQFIDSLLDSRMTFEVAAAVEAAACRTDEDLEELKDVLKEEALAVTIDQHVLADVKFHHTVTVISHNLVYPVLLKSFEGLVIKLVTFFYQNNFDREFVYSRHKNICKAIADKNAELAAEEMRALLRQGEDVVKAFVK